MKIKHWNGLTEFQQKVLNLLFVGTAECFLLAETLLLGKVLETNPNFCNGDFLSAKSTVKINIEQARFLRDLQALKILSYPCRLRDFYVTVAGLLEKRLSISKCSTCPPKPNQKYFHLFIDVDRYLLDWGEARCIALSTFPFEAKNNLVFTVSLRAKESIVSKETATKITKFCASFCPMVAKFYPDAIVNLQVEIPEYTLDNFGRVATGIYIDKDAVFCQLFSEYVTNPAQKTIIAPYYYYSDFHISKDEIIKSTGLDRAKNCVFISEYSMPRHIRYICDNTASNNLTYKIID